MGLETRSVPLVAVLTTVSEDVKAGMSDFNPACYDNEMRRQWAYE
jgi:hypothetical protein